MIVIVGIACFALGIFAGWLIFKPAAPVNDWPVNRDYDDEKDYRE